MNKHIANALAEDIARRDEEGEATFAKLFNTPHGQLLAFLSETDCGEPAITVIGHGGQIKTHMLGWPDGEKDRLAAFAKINQAGAEKLAEQIATIAKGTIG